MNTLLANANEPCVESHAGEKCVGEEIIVDEGHVKRDEDVKFQQITFASILMKK